MAEPKIVRSTRKGFNLEVNQEIAERVARNHEYFYGDENSHDERMTTRIDATGWIMTVTHRQRRYACWTDYRDGDPALCGKAAIWMV